MAYPSNPNTFFQYTSLGIPIFDGEYYDYWSSPMKTFFISQDLWDVVEEGYQEHPQPTTLLGNQLKQYKETMKKDASNLH